MTAPQFQGDDELDVMLDSAEPAAALQEYADRDDQRALWRLGRASAGAWRP